MTEIVFVCLGIAITVPGVVTAVRALPPVAAKVLEGAKPWACNICMSFWATSLVTSVAAAYLQEIGVLLLAGPAYTLALVLLERVVEAPPAGGPQPELPQE